MATQWSCWVEPKGSIPTAVLICMLVSNNVLVNSSSECSFLLPSHETSAVLEVSLRLRHYRAEQGQQTEQKAIKTLMHVISAQHILKWCATSINIRHRLFKETLNAVNKTKGGVSSKSLINKRFGLHVQFKQNKTLDLRLDRHTDALCDYCPNNKRCKHQPQSNAMLSLAR